MLSTTAFIICFIPAILALLFSLIAIARLGKFIESTKGLEWNDIANMTGEIATIKKTIQTLNNRMNGMNSPRLQEQEILAQYLQNQQPRKPNGQGLGG